MKRLLILLLLVAIAVVGGAYIFISDEVQITKVALLRVNRKTAFRCVTQRDLIKSFLDDSLTSQPDGNAYAFNRDDIAFTFKRRMFDLVEVPINYKDSEWSSFISFNELAPDSTRVEWSTKMEMSANPFKRIQQYQHAGKIHQSMAEILKQLQKFTANNENIYRFKIVRTKLADSLLVTTKSISKAYPSNEEYYTLIQKLQKYLSDNKATPVNYPMLNIARVDSNKYETTVAIPVNKVLPANGDILFKKMFPGNILTADVSGGLYTVEEGFRQLTNYVSDFQLVPPAIPFQSLVTDRLLQKDTAKWMTKLYYPIY
ncbi:MAG TPA: hypothetical protein VEY06_03720 [Flavisolibacter sp.]|nr:hypothetical protein [Flavisolibacter sp.]